MTDYSDRISRSSDPIIALDLDGVCSKTRHGFVRHMEDIYDINIPSSRMYNRALRIPEMNKTYGELVEDVVERNPDIYMRMNPIKGAPLATRTLNRFYDIRIVSNRFNQNWLSKSTRDKVFDITKSWLDKNGFSYDSIECPISEKKDIVSDYFIDDMPEVLEDIRDDNTSKPIMFLRPHNMNSIPYEVWNASDSTDDEPRKYVENPQEQWKVITEYLKR